MFHDKVKEIPSCIASIMFTWGREVVQQGYCLEKVNIGYERKRISIEGTLSKTTIFTVFDRK